MLLCAYDSSIAIAALGLGPNDLIQDLETFGLMFENRDSVWIMRYNMKAERILPTLSALFNKYY